AGLREQDLAHKASRSAAELRALLDNMAEGVAVFDAARQVVLVNALGRALLGFGAANPTIDDYRACELRTIDGGRLDFARDVLDPLLEGTRVVDEDVLVRRPDGSQRRLAWSGSAVRDERGQVVLALKVFRDVTELWELETARQ